MFKLSTIFLMVFVINIAKTHTTKVKKHSFQETDWWQSATIYQIYPRSFKDSDADGIGDLNGIIEKLDYLQDLGITAIWLSPIYKSPQYDNGYDISDFRDIDPVYGTLDIFKKLIVESRKRGLKVILDYVPNHTSIDHEWFKESSNGTEEYKDYFVWADGKNGTKEEPPNNWISVFRNSAWEWSEERKQFYLHQFLKQQPDLNYLNDKVKQEMQDILSFWLDTLDVDGVRIDAVPHLVEAKNLTDEPESNDPNYSDIDYNFLNHIFTINQPETYEVIYDWRRHLDSISSTKNSTRVMFTEAGTDLDHVMLYYGSADGSNLGAHFSFNFNFLGLTKESSAQDLSDLIDLWFSKIPNIYTSNWLLGNHDNHRIASKVGKERVDALNMLVGFLPGVQITYDGEEIGMEDGEVTCDQGKDMTDNCTVYNETSRDFERTPMQWDDSEFAGFTNGSSTWLPVSSKKSECNVADQLKDPRSHLSVYKKLQEIRKDLRDLDKIESIVFGNNMGLILQRTRDDIEISYSLYINFGDIELVTNTPLSEVLISSANSNRSWGQIIDGLITLDPFEALLVLSEDIIPI